MPTTTNLTELPADALAAELTRREAEAARQHAEAEAAWKAEQTRRAREVLDEWEAKDAELLGSSADDEAAFREAVLADPVLAAYGRVRQHRYRRANLRSEAQTAAHLLGEQETADRITPLNDWGHRLNEDVASIVEAAAQQAAYAESEVVLSHLNDPST